MKLIKERTPCGCGGDISISYDGCKHEICSCGMTIFNVNTHRFYLKCEYCNNIKYGEYDKLFFNHHICLKCGK